jgi:hypothetical protein
MRGGARPRLDPPYEWPTTESANKSKSMSANLGFGQVILGF